MLTTRFPGVPLEEYVYGAMIANPDAKRQYEQIMEFPPFMSDIEQGKKIWDMPFHNGKTFADCFPNGGRNVAGRYPYFDPARGKVVTFDMALNDCRRANGEASRLSFIIYLNDDFSGGETTVVDKTIKPRRGMALLFRHELLHEGRAVKSGTKYVMRTDVMYGPLGETRG